jgi:prepilin-type processing-associated H-X9-DG protein
MDMFDDASFVTPAIFKAAQTGYGKVCTGLFYPLSTVSINQVLDGTSNTLLAAEKYLCPDNYENGLDGGDNVIMYCGTDDDNVRWTDAIMGNGRPMRDTPGADAHGDFGSTHAGGFNAAMCDGSVRQISYGVSTIVYQNLANRRDGLVIDPTELAF